MELRKVGIYTYGRSISIILGYENKINLYFIVILNKNSVFLLLKTI